MGKAPMAYAVGALLYPLMSEKIPILDGSSCRVSGNAFMPIV
nr:MAG TPA: hypothetical protein [Caudoviricetes sp.]